MILSLQEAADILRYTSGDELPPSVTSVVLPAIDQYLQNATGFAWGRTTKCYKKINPLAKQAAAMLLVTWHDDPGQMGNVSPLAFGLLNLIGQLQVKAERLKEA